MDRRPRAESARLMATASHLPLVALVALIWPSWRSVGLVRHHALLALSLQGLTLGLLFAGSLLSGLVANLPGLGLYLTMGIGVLNLLAMLGWAGLSIYAAYGAYEGVRTHFPWMAETQGAKRAARGALPLAPSQAQVPPSVAREKPVELAPEMAHDDADFRPPSA